MIPCLIGSNIFLEALRATEQVSHQDADQSDDFSMFGVNESLLRLFHASRYDSKVSHPQTLNSLLPNITQTIGFSKEDL